MHRLAAAHVWTEDQMMDILVEEDHPTAQMLLEDLPWYPNLEVFPSIYSRNRNNSELIDPTGVPCINIREPHYDCRLSWKQNENLRGLYQEEVIGLSEELLVYLCLEIVQAFKSVVEALPRKIEESNIKTVVGALRKRFQELILYL
ncbi:hypothetical protein Aduo_016304 [Ancylostoma duodenale]